MATTFLALDQSITNPSSDLANLVRAQSCDAYEAGHYRPATTVPATTVPATTVPPLPSNQFFETQNVINRNGT
uniref:Uncharacterized protein n=1 Tax=Globodera rostochiensis TaxID=31243 RepID=A0A914HFT0_GLORO